MKTGRRITSFDKRRRAVTGAAAPGHVIVLGERLGRRVNKRRVLICSAVCNFIAHRRSADFTSNVVVSRPLINSSITSEPSLIGR